MLRYSLLCVLLCLLAACTPPQGHSRGHSPAVRTGIAVSTTVQEASNFVGTLEAKRFARLRAKASGTIIDIPVREGEHVAAGTTILSIEPEQARAQLQSQKGYLDAAAMEIEESEANLRAVEAERRASSAQAKLAQRNLHRGEASFAEGLIAREELERMQQDASSQSAKAQAASQRVAVARTVLRKARASYQTARGDFRFARERLADTQVKAPFSGTVGNLPTKLGNFVSVGEEVTTLTQNDSLDLRLAIPLEYEPHLRMGLAVRINSKIPTINDHVGRINFIDTVVNEDTQSIVAKARFPNHRGHLREGQFVTAVITWEVKPNTILVPTNALVSEGDKTYLFVVAGEFRPPQPELSWWQRSWGELMRLFSHPNGDRAPSLQKISKRRVQLGMIKGDRTEITEGLQSGQEYVTSGVQMLADGMPVRVLDSQREAL